MNHLAKALAVILAMGGLAMVQAAELELGANDAPKAPLPVQREQAFLSESDADFRRVPNTWSWISDVEHVVEKSQKKLVFLADGKPPYYMCGDTIPAGRNFELFPYHYYDQWEVDQLGGRVNYKMIAQNRTDKEITLEITGQGFVTNWNNWLTWERALRGEGARTIVLQPGEIVTLWEEKQLEGGLPWSGIVFGRASGDLWVCDYAYLGEKDPSICYAQQMPDIGWPPYLLASFTRGSADWNAAEIAMWPRHRDADGQLPLSKLAGRQDSIAFAYSPGGPPTDLCYYNAVPATFVKDVLNVTDPVSGYKHVFLGGNYTIMYRFKLPLVNDTDEPRTVDFHLASNDIFGVDSFAGVWIGGEFLHTRVTMWPKNEHWKVFSLTLAPGEKIEHEFTVVPLGSRWGGMVGTFDIY